MYKGKRVEHSKPRPGVIIWDYKDHPWFKPESRFQAQQEQNGGSVSLSGPTPEKALKNLDEHLQRVALRG